MKTSPLRFLGTFLGFGGCGPIKAGAASSAHDKVVYTSDAEMSPPPRPATVQQPRIEAKAPSVADDDSMHDQLGLEDLYWNHELFSSLRESLTRIYYRTACTLFDHRPDIVRHIARELSETVDPLDRDKLKRHFVKYIFKKIRIFRGDDILDEIEDLKERLADDYVGPEWLKAEAASELVRMQKLADETCAPFGRHRAYRQGPNVIRPPSIATIIESPDETDNAESDSGASCGGSVIVCVEYETYGDITDTADLETFRATFNPGPPAPWVPGPGESVLDWMRQTGAFFDGDLPPRPDAPTPWDVEEKGFLSRGFSRVKTAFVKTRSKWRR